MVGRASVVAFAIALGACGASTAAAPSHPAATFSQPESANGFGMPALAAARAMLAASQKRAYDAGWNCANPSTDLRATQPAAADAVAKLGPSPVMVVAALRVLLDASADDAPVKDLPDKGGASRVFVNGYANVGPDARVTWSEVRAYASALEEPNKERANVDDLAPPLRAELARLVESASRPACNVPVTTMDDIESLPYAMGVEEKYDIARALDANMRGLANVCALASKAKPPWEAHFSHLEAVFVGGGALVKLRSKLHLQNGAVCLDAVEVVKVAQL